MADVGQKAVFYPVVSNHVLNTEGRDDVLLRLALVRVLERVDAGLVASVRTY